MEQFKMKPLLIGNCIDCGSDKLETPERCATCGAIHRKSERESMKVKVVRPVKKVTAKRANQNQQYAKLRREYLEHYPACEVIDCNNRSSEIHHQKGRENDLLLDTNYFMAVCKSCHHRITIDSQWAISEGYSIIRSVTPPKQTI